MDGRLYADIPEKRDTSPPIRNTGAVWPSVFELRGGPARGGPALPPFRSSRGHDGGLITGKMPGAHF